MGEMHATTVEYLKTRRQFGRPIGEFQVLQHRSVDMFVALEQARSMAMLRDHDGGRGRPRGARLAVSAAKVQIGLSGAA